MNRPRKPNALKEIDGNPGKRPFQKDAPAIDTEELPEAPQWLSDEAVLKWYETGAILFKYGLLTTADTDSFANYCTAYALWQDAQDHLQKEGQVLTVTNDKGYTYQVRSPWGLVAKDNIAVVIKFQTQFGLTPSSRSGLPIKEQEEANPFAELISRQKANKIA